MKKKKNPAHSEAQASGKIEMLAVVRVKGNPDIQNGVADTLKMLKLNRVNHCVIVEKNRSMIGMLKKVQQVVTWGEVNKETLEKLVFKRGRLPGNKRLEKEQAKKISEDILNGKKISVIKPVFRLNPPSKGYKSKRTYPKGDLGYRKDKINELLKRMI